MKGMDRDSELALVGRLRAGDPDAFDAVHDCFNAVIQLPRSIVAATRGGRRPPRRDLVTPGRPGPRPPGRHAVGALAVHRAAQSPRQLSTFGMLEDSHAVGLIGTLAIGVGAALAI
jgi:hypothetical protein